MSNIWIESWHHCDPVGKAVLVVLVLFSICSWAIMAEKLFLYRRAGRGNKTFNDRFHEGKIPESGWSLWGSIFNRVLKEKQKIALLNQEKLSNILKRASREEFRSFESGLDFLLLTSSVAPFLGLLGTVWGLLLAFHNMGITGSSSVSVVASGVAEALITTVAGLIVAIPAAIGYNVLSGRLRTLEREGENVLESFFIFFK